MQDGEFVATQPCDRVALAEKLRQPNGKFADQAVARMMPERIVDMLEAVEIEHHHRDARALLRAGDGVVQPILEQRPVRQSGQHVVESQMMSMGLACLQLEHRPLQSRRRLLQPIDERAEKKQDRDRRDCGRRTDGQGSVSRKFRPPDEVADAPSGIGRTGTEISPT